jgi:putative transposase
LPRRRRVFVEGGLYHVYNRFARGEEVFAAPEEATEFVELLRDVRQRDEVTIYAWALLSNHYHIALRTSSVPLSRSMHYLQGTFSRRFNRRWRRTGPVWQSRYQARTIDDQRYFDQVMIYVHLNPVRAGLAEDPGDFMFSGHRELMGKVKNSLVDVDNALIGFGDTLRTARRHYSARIRAAEPFRREYDLVCERPQSCSLRDHDAPAGRSRGRVWRTPAPPPIPRTPSRSPTNRKNLRPPEGGRFFRLVAGAGFEPATFGL